MKIVFYEDDLTDAGKHRPLEELNIRYIRWLTGLFTTVSKANIIIIEKDGKCKWIKNRYGPLGIYNCNEEPKYLISVTGEK